MAFRRMTGKTGGSEGEAAARGILLLAFFLLFAAGLSGCRSAAPAVPRYFVRLEDLISLHPLWKQYFAQERTRLVFPTAVATTVLSGTGTRLPAPFAPQEVTPLRPTITQLRPFEDNTRAYLSRVVERLRRNNRRILTREERAERERIEEELEALRLKLETAYRAENLKEIRRIEREIYLLGFREVVYRAQARVLADQPLIDARIQLEQVERQIAANRERAAALPDTVQPKVQAEVNKERSARLDVLDQKLQDRQEKLDQTADRLEQQLSQRPVITEERLLANRASIPPITRPQAVSPPTLALPPASDQTPDFLRAQALVQAAETVSRDSPAARQSRWMALIREETRRAVEEIARREGWQPVIVETPGVFDRTEIVAESLRNYWRPTPLPEEKEGS